MLDWQEYHPVVPYEKNTLGRGGEYNIRQHKLPMGAVELVPLYSQISLCLRFYQASDLRL